MTSNYMIWSHYHKQWWRPHESGYTPRVDEAGEYTKHDAARIVLQSLRNTAVPVVLASRMIGLGHELVEREILAMRGV